MRGVRLVGDIKFNQALLHWFKKISIPSFNKAVLFLLCHKVALGEAFFDENTQTISFNYNSLFPFMSRRKFDALLSRTCGINLTGSIKEKESVVSLSTGTVPMPALYQSTRYEDVIICAPSWLIHWTLITDPNYVMTIPFAIDGRILLNSSFWKKDKDTHAYAQHVRNLYEIGNREVLIHTGTSMLRALKSLSTSPSIYDQELAIRGLVLYSLFVMPDDYLVEKSEKNGGIFFVDRTFFDLFFSGNAPDKLGLTILGRKNGYYTVLLRPEIKLPTYAVPCRMKRLRLGQIEGYKSLRRFVCDLRKTNAGGKSNVCYEG